MVDRSPLNSEEQTLEASTSYSDDGLSLGEGKDRYSQGDTYSDEFASQVSILSSCAPTSRWISVGLYQVEAASSGQKRYPSQTCSSMSTMNLRADIVAKITPNAGF